MATRSLPDRNGSISDGELVFLATLPPLGFSTYFVEKSTGLADSARSGIIRLRDLLILH